MFNYLSSCQMVWFSNGGLNLDYGKQLIDVKLLIKKLKSGLLFIGSNKSQGGEQPFKIQHKKAQNSDKSGFV